MFLYIESLFADGGEREVKPLHSIPDTLNGLYLLAMREHRRKAVTEHKVDGKWRSTPDWRYDRHVLRLALYLDDRVSIARGDRIAVISELTPEWPLADLASICLGATSVSIPIAASRDAVAAAFADERPKVVYVSSAALAEFAAAFDLFEEIERVIVFDDSPRRRSDEAGSTVETIETALDLGGTLDTPERANDMRERARAAKPDAIAVRHYELADDGGSLRPTELTQGEIIERLKMLWAQGPAREGDRVYLSEGDVSLASRHALYAHMGDGYSTTYLGDPGEAAGDIVELQPQKIVAPAELIRSVVGADRDESGRAAADHEAIAKAVEALGGHVRWIGPTTSPDPQLAELLSSAVSAASRDNGF